MHSRDLVKRACRFLQRSAVKTGLPVVTEAIDHENIDMVAEYADVVQIGARNMQNFSLLKKAGKIGKPVLLKRGIAATVDEWLMAAEYIMDAGNPNIVLCERGVRTFADHSRNTLDISAIPVVQRESHLPVIVDPSHAAGRRDQVLQLGCAAVAAGAQGLIVEVHHSPDSALSDGAQSLYPHQFKELYQRASASLRSAGVLCRRSGNNKNQQRGNRPCISSTSRQERNSEKWRARGNLVPVCLEFLADTDTPVSVIAKLRSSSGTSFLLESVEGGDRWARYSFLGNSSKKTIKVYSDTLEVEDESGTSTVAHGGDPLPPLRS